MSAVEFWYEFASTYSYPAAMRIEALARQRGVALIWRPFLLGPIFVSQGWTTSPFNLYPAKGRNMARDLERVCAKQGLPFRMPDPFPQNSLLAARVALAIDDALRPAFSKAVYRAEFADGRAIDDRAVLAEILAGLGADPQSTFAAAQSDATKARLREESGRAVELGLFGAPSVITADGELFWGNDRLEDALDWAAGPAATLDTGGTISP